MSTTINRMMIGFETLFPTSILQVSHLFNDDVLLYLTYIPYQYLHTPWLREQPTYMAHNDLHSMNIIIL